MNTVYQRRRGSFWGLALVIVGFAFLGDNLGWFDFDIWEIVWPLIIIVFGLNLLIRRNRRVEIHATVEATPPGASTPPPPPPPFSGAAQGASTDRINESHAMGELDLVVDSQAFRGGAVSTVFGDVRLDCYRAVLADGEQQMSVNTVFGSVKIVVPPTWEYTVEATTVFGEVEAASTRRGGIFSNVVATTQGFETAPRRLRINASTVFGEIRVVTR